MDRSSDQTRYYRFFGPMKRLSAKELHRFTHVDHDNRVAFVVLLGDQVIGVGRYDRYPGTDDAEVAFLIEDAHQRRGLGSVLLEHLAAAARERGIKRFVAEVLAQNSTMVRVFQDAGYKSQRSYEDGVVHLSFPIEPTEDALAVAYEREQRSESRSIARLLTPSSVAVVGASNDDGQDRQRAAPAPAGLRLRRPGLPGQPLRPARPRGPGLRRHRVHPRRRRPRPRGGAGRRGRRRGRGLPAQAGARPGRGLRRFRGVRARGAGGRAPAGRLRARLRHARRRPQLPGRGQHRPGGAAQRLAGADGPGPRPGRVLRPVRRARGRPARAGAQPGHRAVHLRLGRQPGRRQRQRPAPVLGDRPGHRGRAAAPGELRQPAQVRPPGAHGRAAPSRSSR